MKKIIKGTAMMTGVLLVTLGLIACMCETADFGAQVMTMSGGILLVAIGAITCYLGCAEDEGSEYIC